MCIRDSHIIRQQKQPISSTQLARLLNVTPRSVKNYVAAIQEEFPDLIAAGPRGDVYKRQEIKAGILAKYPLTE